LVRTVSVADVGANLSDILGSVHESKEAVVVERDGVPYAVVVSPEQYAGLRDAETADWDLIEQIAAQNADKDPGAVLAAATAAVESVRQEVYRESQRAARRR
jgi:PHD/YefM family antitoxin component YafN of YafNO toxin-antitoxin module